MTELSAVKQLRPILKMSMTRRWCRDCNCASSCRASIFGKRARNDVGIEKSISRSRKAVVVWGVVQPPDPIVTRGWCGGGGASSLLDTVAAVVALAG